MRALIVLISLVSSLASAAQLSEVETRWLSAGLPVLAFAKQQLRLPIDIVVQPQAQPGDVPLALGFDQGRCKLVLSMRGNPQAEAVLQALPPEQHQLMIEAMTAHEIGHCWRYVQGAWHALPAGFVENLAPVVTPELLPLAQSLRATRREEGYADLVALAWIQQQHPAQYALVVAWLDKVRQPALEEGSVGSHDTRVWLHLAPRGAAFDASQSLFEQAATLWRQGLLADDAL
ncbi:MAG: hypothetical protein ACEQSK_12840 [Sphingomonadaceae bacterium]